MKLFRRELLLYALVACMILMSACTSPGYNDNPSQQITNAKVGCPVSTDFFAVYFTLHVQPSSDNQDARITKDLFRSYCRDIPAPGKVFLTADLVGNELRKIPIGIRIVEQEPGDNGNSSGTFKDISVISEVLPRTYAKGVIESQFELNKNGHYAIYLTKGGDDAASEEKLTIPLDVGIDSGAKPLTAQIIMLFEIALGLAFIGFVAFRYMRGRTIL